LVFSGSAVAQSNLLTNPGLETDLSGWENLYDLPAVWDPADAGGSMSSGSALITEDSKPGNGGVPITLTQCVTVSPVTEYSVGGTFMVPANQSAETAGYIFAFTYPTSDCSGEGSRVAEIGSSSVNAWETKSSTITTGANVQSMKLALGPDKATGLNDDAKVHFDDLFILREGGLINPSMSVAWFNPDESGHGIMLNLMNNVQAWMCWFTFDLAGNPDWICGLGDINEDTITFNDAFTVDGGAFPPNFDPDQIVEQPWGSITVVFTDCDAGTMTWTTSSAGFQSGSMPLVRLTKLWGNSCF